MFHLGCAVWAYRDWVGPFYPPRARADDFLRLYGERLTAVEGNTTFYSIPDAQTVDRWAAQTPETFRFCPKVPRIYSHSGPLMPYLQSAIAFLRTLQRLGPRLGPLMLQLPPSYGPNLIKDLGDFLIGWPREEAPIAVEVRHPDWFRLPDATHLNDLLQRLGVARVLLDTRPMYDGLAAGFSDPQMGSARRKPKLPLQPVLTAPLTVVRYISHPNLDFNASYLSEWQQRLHLWLQQDVEVYVFVHCPDEARSPAIARYLHHQLRQQGAPVPDLPWDSIGAPPTQLELF